MSIYQNKRFKAEGSVFTSCKEDEILDEIKALRADLKLGNNDDSSDPQSALCDDFSIVDRLVMISDFIEKSKKQISLMSQSVIQEEEILGANNELTAIVQHTENATHNILENAELIENYLDSFEAFKDFEAKEKIIGCVIKIFENCNFQDITGQRISKIVTTLGVVEENLKDLIHIWGKDNISSFSQELSDHQAKNDLNIQELDGDENEKRLKQKEEGLLEGPQLDGFGISQNEIDEMFVDKK